MSSVTCFVNLRGIEWSLRAFVSMRAVRLFLRARAVIKLPCEQRALGFRKYLMTSGEHSATVDTVVTSIVVKMSVAKSRYFKHFESKSIHFQSDILESLLALLSGILSYFASWRVYKLVGLPWCKTNPSRSALLGLP